MDKITLRVDVDEDVFFALSQYKINWRCRNWEQFFVRLIEVLNALEFVEEIPEVKESGSDDSSARKPTEENYLD